MRPAARRAFQTLDVTDTAAVAVWSAGQPAFDILVNNAGMNRPKHFHDVTEDDYDAIMGLNVRAAFFFQPGHFASDGRRQNARIHHSYVLADGACGWSDANGLLRVQMGT